MFFGIFLHLTLIFSHLQKAKGGWEGWSDVLLHDSHWNGMWHQKWPFFGARRVWWESLRDKNQLHPWGDGNRKNLHLGRESTGRGNTSTPLLIHLSLPFSSFHCSVILPPPRLSRYCEHRSSCPTLCSSKLRTLKFSKLWIGQQSNQEWLPNS